jgi:uncharacterized protein (TIGR03086 family)
MQINDWRAAVELDRRAVQATVGVVSGCADLTLPTPCAGCCLRDLLAHMTVQQHGFARAVDGELTSVEDWAPRHAEDPIAAYAEASRQVLAAFAAVDDPSRPVLLPEIRDEPVSAQLALGFHLVDNVVHAWDVAVSIGVQPALDADVLTAALFVARQVPDGDERNRPGAAFAPGLAVGSGASTLDEILLLLGRDPARFTPRISQ